MQKIKSKVTMPDEWWEQRARWMPTGSSSLHKKLIKEYQNVDQGAERMTKKAAAEHLDFNDLVRILQSTPCAIARTSTKNEPGKKNRPLYAVNDENTIVAMYASQYVESAMD